MENTELGIVLGFLGNVMEEETSGDEIRGIFDKIL